MMPGMYERHDFEMGSGEEAADLVAAIGGLERDMSLGEGVLIREFTAMLRRRRRFEELRRDHDVRFIERYRGDRPWQD